MKTQSFGWGLVALAVTFTSSLLFISKAPAQEAGQGPGRAVVDNKPTPRMADGHPDFSGFYNVDVYHGDPTSDTGGHVVTKSDDGSLLFDYGGANAQGNGVNYKADGNGEPAPLPNEPDYKPEYMAKVKAIAETMYGNTTNLDPQMECKPYGVPRGATNGGGSSAMLVVQNDKYVAMLYEDRPGPFYRVIYTDGRQHPKDFDSSYFGDSVGHWEGDSLVVDVTGLNDETWLGGGLSGYKLATIHSDKEHVVEHWTRNGDTLKYEATVDDPVMFNKPWVITPRYVSIARPDDYLQPQMCSPHDEGHLIKPTAADTYKCGWCQKNADAIYGEGATKASAAAPKK
jgi:hypothetical protein